jgi:fibronectin-binding autotransporter adhesin
MLIGMAGGGSLQAQTFTWSDANTAIDNNIIDPLNWVGNSLPTGTPDLIFGTATQNLVNLDASLSVNSVTFTGTVNYSITSGTLGLALASGGTIANNSTSSSNIFIGVTGIALSGPVTFTSAATAPGLVIASPVTGTGGVTVTNNSSHPVQLNNGASYSGGTTITAGALQIGSGSTVGATLAGNVSITGTGSLMFFPAALDSVSYTGIISGTGAVSLNGTTGTLTFSGLNTYSGTTAVNGGTLADGVTGAFSPNSPIRVNSGGGQLTVNFDETIAGLQNGGTGGLVNLAVTGKTLTINTSVVNPTAFNGVISGPGNLALSGTGSLGQLGLSGANTYTGTTTVNNGTLYVTNSTGSGTGTGTVTVASGATLEFGQPGAGSGTGSVGGNIVDNGTVILNLTGVNTVGNVISGSGSLTKSAVSTIALTGASTYAGGTAITGTLFAENSSGSATGTGPITINIGGSLEIGAVGGSVGAVSPGSSITDNGSLQFNLTGASSFGNAVSGSGGLFQFGGGTLTLTGANIYTGPTFINSGTIADGVPGAFAPTSTVSFNNSTLTANFPETIGGLSGPNGTVSLPNPTNLTVAPGGAFTFGGTISGAGGIIKSGSGSETLSGANTYLGGTAVNSGILFISNATGSGTGSGTVTIASLGTFQIGANGGGATGSVSGSIVDNGTFNFSLTAPASFGNAVSGTGQLQDLNVGTITFSNSGALTYSGATVINAGTIADSAPGAFSPNSLMVVKAGTNLKVNFNETVGGLTGAGGVAGAISLASGAILTELNSITRTFQGTISGLGGLTVGGTGTTIIPIADGYTGLTTINPGATLQLGNNGGSAGTVSSSAVVDNGTLAFIEGVDTTYSNPTSGTGAVVVGAVSGGTNGNLTIPNANTYSGGTTLNSGTLLITNSSGSALGSGPVLVTSSTPSVVASGGFLGGNGRFTGALTLGGGGLVLPATSNSNTIFPATLSTGAASFAGNAGMVFVLNNATGAAGTNWGLLSISGALTITATGGSPFLLSLNTADPGTNMGGQASNFNPASTYSWEIVATTGGITGFAPNEFNILTTAEGGNLPGFVNNTLGGNFFVSQVGNNLFLNFTPVPEPSTWALLLTGSVGMAAGVWRRKRAGKLF